jgi:cytosine/adenosine deaminase-related metal-dependent hydrolase
MTVTVYKNAQLQGCDTTTDIAVVNGKFAKIGGDLSDYEKNGNTVDLKGNLVIPPFADAHIHLDYIYTASLPTHETTSGTLFEAIDNWSDSKASLTADIIKERALKGVKMQISHGVQYVRSHVDVTDPKLTALKALLELKTELKDYIDLQIVAFPQEGYFAYKGGAELVEEALKMGADMVRNTIGIASKEWAMIRPRMVLLRPTLAKLAYKATPVITTGTIIGVSIRFKNRFLPLNFSLLTANAAKVPMVVAKTATQIAMNKLRSNDVIHCSFIKNLSYHFKEKLLIG